MQKCLLFVLLFTLSLTVTAQTIVERHGQLTVSGNRIKDECGRVTQLKGMSYFWSQWDGKEYYNANAVKWLRDDWKVEVVRAALGISPGSPDYIANPTENYNRVTAVLDGAVQHGIYGIADFHAHEADKYLAQSKTFFRQISQRYGDKPNIIYEIWNEPIGSSDDNDAAVALRGLRLRPTPGRSSPSSGLMTRTGSLSLAPPFTLSASTWLPNRRLPPISTVSPSVTWRIPSTPT